MQGIWWDDVPMMMLPHMTEDAAEGLMQQGLRSLHQLRQAALGQPAAMKTRLASLLGGSKQAAECLQVRSFCASPQSSHVLAHRGLFHGPSATWTLQQEEENIDTLLAIQQPG